MQMPKAMAAMSRVPRVVSPQLDQRIDKIDHQRLIPAEDFLRRLRDACILAEAAPSSGLDQELVQRSDEGLFVSDVGGWH